MIAFSKSQIWIKILEPTAKSFILKYGHEKQLLDKKLNAVNLNYRFETWI